jgi:glycosyltransferase involved in cell wall biosynthesis
MVTGAYYPELSGGGLQCKTIVDALRDELSFRVLTTSTDPALPIDDEVDGTSVHRVLIDVSRARSKARAAVALTAAMLRWRHEIDIVHLHGFSGKSVLLILIAKLTGKRIVLTLHTAGQDEPEAVRRMGALAARAYRAVDLYVAVSRGMAARAETQGIPASRVRTISNGVDVRRFRIPAAGERDAARRALRLPVNQTLILFVGFFSEDKGPHVLFDAWRQIAHAAAADSSLVLIGATSSRYFEVDSALAAGIRAGAASGGLSDRVIFVEETRAIDEYYRAADVFVFPSRREAFGMALVEAMASGLPCIASRLPGVTDQIVEDDVTGLLVPPHDASAIARKLECVLTDDRLAARLGAAARESVVARFSADVTARAMADAYRHVLDASATVTTAA